MSARRKPQKMLNENDVKLKEQIKSVKDIEKRKVPLRIDEKKTIFVYPENCNDAYRQQYIKRLEESAQVKVR